MGRPYRINLRCDYDFYLMVSKYAESKDTTISELIRKVVTEHIINERREDNAKLCCKLKA